MEEISSQRFLSKELVKREAVKLVIFSLVCVLTTRGSSEAVSLTSEKCDPFKVAPDETSVKAGWQAEVFNGLSFRTCDQKCMPQVNRESILDCFRSGSPKAFEFYKECTQNMTTLCSPQNKREIHYCLASKSQSFIEQEKCGQILHESTIKCIEPHLTDQIELCFINENHVKSASSDQTSNQLATGADISGQFDAISKSPRPAKSFLKQFEYANYNLLRHTCDPELEFDQQISAQEIVEIQTFYTIASTLCRDECMPVKSRKLMRDCLLKNSPNGAKVYSQCTSRFGQACTPENEGYLTSCFNTLAQNMAMNEKCVELVTDDTQKCWSNLIKNETMHCVERKNLQTVSFEYGRVCNAADFVERQKEEQNQVIMAHKTNQENLLRRALEVMCFPSCVSDGQRVKMSKCLENDSPLAHGIYEYCSKNSGIKCDMDDNIAVYAEYVNCIYSEADRVGKETVENGTCVNFVESSSFKCLENLYPGEMFACPEVKVFNEAVAQQSNESPLPEDGSDGQ